MHNGGGTALFDAVYDACEKLTSAEAGEAEARILIVLSDGDNNSGQKTLSRAIEMAQMRDVTIYAINTRNESSDSIYLAGMAKSDAAMKELAVQTGGRSFVELSDREVTRAFSIIEDEMRNRYSVSYQPRDLEENGQFPSYRYCGRKIRTAVSRTRSQGILREGKNSVISGSRRQSRG